MDNIFNLDSVLWSAGLLMGAMSRPDIRKWCLERGMTEAQIDAILEALRPLHAATYREPR